MRLTSLGNTLLILPLFAGCAELATVGAPIFDTYQSQYSAKPITLWLVDEVTGKPIEEAIITANWELVTGSYAGGAVVRGQQKVMEAVSDKDGKVFFPAWGPEPNRHSGHIRENDPQMFVYKEGYEPLRLFNWQESFQYPKDALRISQWNGRVVKLYIPGIYRHTVALGFTGTDLSGIEAGLNIANSKSCYWTDLPRMTALLLKEHLLDRSNLREAVCGTLESALKGGRQ